MTTDNARYSQINIPTFNQSISTTAVHLAQRTRSTDYKTRLKLESPQSRSHWPAQQHFSPTVITEVGGMLDLANFRLVVTYLVSNSRLLFSHGRPSHQLPSSRFPAVTLNFDLWPWPSNLTYRVSRWTGTPNIKSYRPVTETDRHTHTHWMDRSTRTHMDGYLLQDTEMVSRIILT